MLTLPICLIIPPSPFLADERVFPSLGILKVAAVLEQAENEVVVVDLNGIENYCECIEQVVNHQKFSFFGITATSPQMIAVNNISQTIRNQTTIPIVLGGPHVTATVTSAKLDQQGKGSGRGIRQLEDLKKIADILISGDGEIVGLTLIKTIQSHPKYPIVIDADDPDCDLFLTEEILNNLPLPARHLIDLTSYHYEIDGRPSTNLISELGCSYGCNFCGMRNSPSFRRIRARSPESVMGELIHLHDTYGYTGFMFSDDEINIPANFNGLMRKIIEAQQQVGCDFRLRAFVKSNLLTEEQARLMYEAGFRNLLVGFEAGSDRILININKRATRDHNTRCMEIANKYNLKVKALMSIGHPGESEETIRSTEDWLLEVQPDDFDVTLITIYPGTPYSDFSKPHMSIPHAWTFTVPKTGDCLHFYETDFFTDSTYYKGIPGQYRSFVFSDSLNCDDLMALRDRLESDVRSKLGIPFYAVTAARNIETSMGQIPAHIVKSTMGNT